MSKKVKTGISKNEKKKVGKEKSVSDPSSMLILERIKILLEKEGENIEWLATKLGLKTKASLYTGFKRGSISIRQINSIAEILKVKPFYFFENDVIDRLTETVANHNKNPDLKSFLMGFSRDVSKGLPLESAASKTLDPQGFKVNLLL